MNIGVAIIASMSSINVAFFLSCIVKKNVGSIHAHPIWKRRKGNLVCDHWCQMLSIVGYTTIVDYVIICNSFVLDMVSNSRF